MKRTLSHSECRQAAINTGEKIGQRFGFKDRLKVYPVPRGGVPAAYLLATFFFCEIVNTVEEADLVLDDLIDSGATMARYPGKPFFALFSKREDIDFEITGACFSADTWLVFPWEGSEEKSADDIGIRLLQYIGEDATREGLEETPGRFLKAWKEWTSGYGIDPSGLFKDFGDGGEDYDEMVIIDPIPFYSHCEHHLAAIFGTVHLAYLPNGRIAGLSKFARLVDIYAMRLQVQERMTTQIANDIMTYLNPLGCAVLVRARHFCMESRGVKKPGAETSTIAIRGNFKQAETRAEFLNLIKGR
jgi:GTP cyclohydrolase I